MYHAYLFIIVICATLRVAIVDLTLGLAFALISIQHMVCSLYLCDRQSLATRNPPASSDGMRENTYEKRQMLTYVYFSRIRFFYF